jgi:hypothetical protein
MADDRRLITGTSIFAKQSATLEEGTTKWYKDTVITKPLGGKCTIDDISANQGANGWYSESTTISGENQLKDTTDVFNTVYIKNLDESVYVTIAMYNLGTWNSIATNWDATTSMYNPEFWLKVAPLGSMLFSGNGTLQCKDVFVSSNADCKIEYLITI